MSEIRAWHGAGVDARDIALALIKIDRSLIWRTHSDPCVAEKHAVKRLAPMVRYALRQNIKPEPVEKLERLVERYRRLLSDAEARLRKRIREGK